MSGSVESFFLNSLNIFKIMKKEITRVDVGSVAMI